MPHTTGTFKQHNDFLKISVDSLKPPDKLRKMKVLIEISDELGEVLTRIANDEKRSKTAQASLIVERVLSAVIAESELQPETAEA